MSFTPKPNSGYLWNNDKKTEDKHPDLRGDALIDKRLLMDLISKGEDPVKIAVSAWKNVSAKTGNEYLYVNFSEPFVPQKRAEPKPAPAPAADDDGEDVPF